MDTVGTREDDNMTWLSVAMIAHNEADCIAASLSSVRWADQIIVVDCDSDDNTAKIAQKAGAEVYREPNRRNLNVNKNISIDHCNSDWVLVLDADEIIPYDLAGEIRKTINETDAAGFLIARRNNILGRWLKYGGQYPDWQLRLFRKDCARFPAVHIHERIKIDGKVDKLTLPFDHYPYLRVTDMLRKGTFYAEFETKYLKDKGHKVSSFGLIIKAGIKPAFRFIRRYIFKGGFLDGIPGLVTAYFDAWNQAVRWIALWDSRRSIPEGNEYE
ncbi:MAG: glycosyltransferase family 2 protein [Candidatus Hatepunaea meridiana]|nr:glycosyltransferase family 2 protein [Candidatus Hatepunaea meridiana]